MHDKTADFLPGTIRVEPLGAASENRARVILEPLERGFGHTLGNALRRILLSSMPGAAVTEAQISKVLHEYSTVEGVREDVVDLLLNLKQLTIRMEGRDHAELHIAKKKADSAWELKAKDIECPNGVEIINPEHVIAHLQPGAVFEATLVAERGRGYVPADQPIEDAVKSRNIGTLRLDASFSPVEQVAYRVDSTRVKQRTDLDKLTIDLKTNGAIGPEEAVRRAATILRQHLASLAEAGTDAQMASHDAEAPEDKFLTQPINVLDQLSARSVNCLHQEGVRYVGDLVQLTERELLGTPNIGKKTLEEITDALKKEGLALGTPLRKWPPQSLLDRSQADRGTIAISDAS